MVFTVSLYVITAVLPVLTRRRPLYEAAADAAIRYEDSFLEAVIDAIDAIDCWFEK